MGGRLTPSVPARAQSASKTWGYYQRYLRERRNWGRWGDDDQRGTLNLVTPAKRAAAAGLVTSGHVVSLARDVEMLGSAGDQRVVIHYVDFNDKGKEIAAADDLFVFHTHGFTSTHLDALCHIVSHEEGMWGGRRADEVLGRHEAKWGDVHQWREGIVTRGLLADVPRARGEPFVSPESPVHGEELDRILVDSGVSPESGDALVVRGGRAAWESSSHGSPFSATQRPGLHASCLEFIRDNDIAVLLWDMLDAYPNEFDQEATVHQAVWAFGLLLVDNCQLDELASACADHGRWEFMVTVAPLRLPGATGCHVNPIALF